jgi:hypothetical protein
MVDSRLEECPTSDKFRYSAETHEEDLLSDDQTTSTFSGLVEHLRYDKFTLRIKGRSGYGGKKSSLACIDKEWLVLILTFIEQ